MVKYSDQLLQLTKGQIASMPTDVSACLTTLSQRYGSEEFRVYAGEPESSVVVYLNLNISKPNRSTEFRSKEPILMSISIDKYPYVAPKIYTDRRDFPAETTPHLNPVEAGTPYSICLFRGDIDSWFAQHSIIDLVERTRMWLEDAASGNLNHKSDEFEFTRIDDPENIMFFQELDTISSINKQRKNSSIALLFSQSIEVVTDKQKLDDPSAMKMIWMLNTSSTLEREAGDVKRKSPKFNGVIMFPDENSVLSQYIVHFPRDLDTLITWSGTNQIDPKVWIKTVEEIASSQSIVPLTFIVQRPRKVINHLSNMEFISYLLYPQLDENGKVLRTSTVRTVQHIQSNSVSLAKFLSNTTEKPIFTKVHQIGLGAVGSKIAIHLARAGIIPSTFVDDDIILPHNNIRFGTTDSLLTLKVEKVTETISEIYVGQKIKDQIVRYPNKILDVVRANPKVFQESNEFIVDSTASYSVENFLTRTLLPGDARYSRIEITHGGNLGITRVEGNRRNPTMGDLMVHLYEMATADQGISDWLISNKLARTKHSLIDELYLGLNCSSDTMKLADDVIACHTAAASVALRDIIGHGGANGIFHITKLNIENGQIENSIRKEVKPVTIIPAVNNIGWQLRMKDGLSECLFSDLLNCSPNETGGILIGKIDQSNKIIYVTQILGPPSDSTSSPFAFIRGVGGLTEEVSKIRSATGESLEYVGEWHSHPAGGSKLSTKDKAAISEIRELLDPLRYPTCIMIVCPKRIYPYVFTKYQ